ncbi:unnamed protein product [Ixodes hexagonus]
MGSKAKTFLDRPPKRGRTEVHILQSIESTEKFPRFLVMHSESEKPLAKLSPFLVSKTLESIIGKNFSTKKMPSGDLLVEITTSEQSMALLSLNAVSDYKVTVSPHRTLNTVKGVVSEDDLLETTEEELVDGLRDQGVVAAKRISLRRDGQEMKTRHVILTSELRKLPESVKAEYLNCRVRPYVPNPRICFHCQRFGHSAQSCRGKTTGAKCGQNDHPADNCANTVHCVNCSGPHPAYSRSCKKWKEEKEIITLKVKEDISFPDARKRLSFLQKGSYSLVTRAEGVSSRTSVGTQVCPKDLVAPPAPPATQRSAPRPRLSLEPKSTRCPEAVPVPSKKAMDTAAPTEASPPKPAGVVHATPPSGPKEGSLPTTSTKEPEWAPLASAGPPAGRGRASTTQASTASRKPGRLDEVHSSASQQSPAEEMMDESMPPLDVDLTISGAESPPVPSQGAEKLKKKKARIPLPPPKGS